MLNREEAVKLMCHGINVKNGILTKEDIDFFQNTWEYLYEVEKLAFAYAPKSRALQEKFIIEHIANIYNVRESTQEEVIKLIKFCLTLIDLKPQEYYNTLN